MEYKYVIMGGGIAGITAAETIRENDPSGSIAVFTKEPHLLYSRVLLPSYLKLKIRRDQLFLRTFNDFEKNRINLFFKRGVKSIDIEKKKILTDGNDWVFYDKLLMATGGEVEKWKVVGADKKGIFRLQTLDDADALMHYLPQVQKAVVVGNSFIALEFLEIFFLRKIPATLFCKSKNFFRDALDSVGQELLYANFKKHGVEPFFQEEVVEVWGDSRVSGLRTSKPAQFSGDCIGVGIGLNKNLQFFDGLGIATGGEGIRTNEYLETNINDIYAAGDITEFYDVIFEKYHAIGNWTNAFLQGKIAGLNMAGQRKIFRNVPFYSITNLGFQITALGKIEAEDGIETISRVNPSFHKYERFFIKNGVIKGAFMINMFSDKPIIARWIENKVSVEHIKDKLTDIDFNLADVVIS